MKIIDPSFEILKFDDFRIIETVGRTCYKSEGLITDTSADAFCRGLISRKHDAVLEHASATVRFITNRGVTHELVRHRICSFAQESTRYVNYEKRGLEFIRPVWCSPHLLGEHHISWLNGVGRLEKQINPELIPTENVFFWSCAEAERNYLDLLELGWKPEQAREVLPNSLKTEIVITTNFREWIHIFNLRAIGTTGRPHPQMGELMTPVLKEFQTRCPIIFGHVGL